MQRSEKWIQGAWTGDGEGEEDIYAIDVVNFIIFSINKLRQ
jgi:hypothetical protein